MFGIEFLGLKLVAGGLVVGGLVYLYNKYKSTDPVASLEKLVGTQIDKLEAFAVKKEAEVQQHVYDALNIEQRKKDAEAAIERAKQLAEKVKGLFS